jgi:RHS repeat-associated protein
MSTTLEQLQYGFDRDSRRTWRQRATTQGWDNTYVYDTLSQVVVDTQGDLNLARNAIAGVPSNGSQWQYDETGNWHGYQTMVNGASTLTQERTHDKGNRLMQVSDASAMRTDRAGRMLETTPGPAGDWNSGYEITWDAWSRITAVASLEAGSVTPVASYAYDGLTRRITRYVDTEAVTMHSYYNRMWRTVEERKGSETTAAASYLWGSRHRDDLVRRDRAVGGTTLNESRYLLMDYFSPASIADESGNVTERYQFSAFGLRTILNPDYTVRSTSECEMEFAFQGQFEDTETAWLNYGYRYYLPSLGRWACKDPIGEKGGNNLYVIAGDNAVNSVDYLGLFDGTGSMGSFGNVNPSDPLFDGRKNPVESGGSPNNPGGLGGDFESSKPGIECSAMEGFWRHCVNTCLLKKLSNGILSNGFADWYTGDDDKFDANSNSDREGAFAGDWAGTQQSCIDACQAPWQNQKNRLCCGIQGKETLDKDSPLCCNEK